MNFPEDIFRPSESRKAPLVEGEVHLHSLQMTEAEKTLFGYKLTLVIFEGHMTNKRLILEAKEFPSWLKPVIAAVFFLFDAPPGAEEKTERDLDEQKKRHDKVAGQPISIPLEVIDRFEFAKNLGFPMVTKLVFTKDARAAAGGMEFYLFVPTLSTAKETAELPLKDRMAHPYLGEAFANFANDWLKRYKA